MNRTFGEWEVSSAVENDGGPFYRPVLWAKHEERGIHRATYFEGFRHTEALQATEFIEQQLQCITGVSDDGSLRIR